MILLQYDAENGRIRQVKTLGPVTLTYGPWTHCRMTSDQTRVGRRPTMAAAPDDAERTHINDRFDMLEVDE
jgi:predicted acyl esterase